MKVLKTLLCIALMACIGIVIYIKFDTRPIEGTAATTPSTEAVESTTEVETEVPEDVPEEDTSNDIEEAVVANTYTITKDDIVYYFMFAIPSNADEIISKVGEAVKEDFTECFIYYLSDDGVSGNYNVLIGEDMFTINVTL